MDVPDRARREASAFAVLSSVGEEVGVQDVESAGVEGLELNTAHGRDHVESNLPLVVLPRRLFELAPGGW